MIKEIKLQNFKCFQNLKKFEFSTLNLLTGINGRGKSSLLQSILLFSQASDKSNSEKLRLNGKYIDLGNFFDIKNSETPQGDKIIVEFDLGFLDAKFTISENEEDNMSANLISEIIMPESNFIATIDKIASTAKDTIVKLMPEKTEEISTQPPVLIQVKDFLYYEMISKIHYISADRLGPVKYVDKISFSDFITVGSRGEHTLNVLANSNLPLVYDQLYRGQDAKSVIQQTEEWLSYILEGANIEINGRDRDSSVLSMLINNKNNSYKYKPTNVGYGYSYVLPLIVSGLIARENEILIIENPEAHLHPRAQSRITEFFAKVASCGVQVFIESHSEHILNGLRISSLNDSIAINHDDLSIHYFDESFESVKLLMDSKGKISNWPEGFFDQQELDLAEIFRFNRK
jgi:predicted ATPase